VLITMDDDFDPYFGMKKSSPFYPSIVMNDDLRSQTRALVAEIEQPLTGEGGEGYRPLFEEGWAGKHDRRTPSPGMLDFSLNDESEGEYLGGARGEDEDEEEDDVDDEEEDDDFEEELEADCGSLVDTSIMHRFCHISSHNFDIDVGLRVIVKRSTGEWSHAEVCAVDAWPPGSGNLTLQVGDGLRKTLNMGKERHMSIVRVPKNTKKLDSLLQKSPTPKSPTPVKKMIMDEGGDDISADFSVSKRPSNNDNNKRRGEADIQEDEDEGYDDEEDNSHQKSKHNESSGDSDYFVTNKLNASTDSFGSPAMRIVQVMSPEKSPGLFVDRPSSPPPIASAYSKSSTEPHGTASSSSATTAAGAMASKNRMLSAGSIEDVRGGGGSMSNDDVTHNTSQKTLDTPGDKVDGDPCNNDVARNDYRSLATGESVSKGSRVLVQRSDGSWSYSTVERVDSWTPEGGSVTVRLGKVCMGMGAFVFMYLFLL
jgi:hypothetical protein